MGCWLEPQCPPRATGGLAWPPLPQPSPLRQALGNPSPPQPVPAAAPSAHKPLSFDGTSFCPGRKTRGPSRLGARLPPQRPLTSALTGRGTPELWSHGQGGQPRGRAPLPLPVLAPRDASCDPSTLHPVTCDGTPWPGSPLHTCGGPAAWAWQGGLQGWGLCQAVGNLQAWGAAPGDGSRREEKVGTQTGGLLSRQEGDLRKDRSGTPRLLRWTLAPALPGTPNVS